MNYIMKLKPPSYPHKITSIKKKLFIIKIRTNSHELHNEIDIWKIPKIPWDKRICIFVT